MNTTDAHIHFSCECFNQTWSLLDLPERSSEQIRKMLALTHASLFHWLNRKDCEPHNLSVSLWQISRVYSTLNSPIEAMRYAHDCLDVSDTATLSPFYMAYAHEASARAAIIARDIDSARSHLNQAIRFAADVAEVEDKKLIDADLVELQQKLA